MAATFTVKTAQEAKRRVKTLMHIPELRCEIHVTGGIWIDMCGEVAFLSSGTYRAVQFKNEWVKVDLKSEGIVWLKPESGQCGYIVKVLGPAE